MIRLYDTARNQVADLQLRQPNKVGIYVCGPTVYGPPHLGHGRSVLVYDILRRFLRWAGYEVTFVSNITDIDDKIINRANDEGRDWNAIAAECEQQWWNAMDALGVERPDETPHATDYVEAMIELIALLIERDAAYVTSDGVYLSVAAVGDYGLLSNQSLVEMRTGGGERDIVGAEKRATADFALWKFSKPNEPAWSSPWGEGRPGWHTECVAMSLDLLGEGFDLHTGGLDLMFPHHENERAQAVACGANFARHWMHHGFVELDGEKMSKSLGNVLDLASVAETYHAGTYRLLVLQSHYRSPMEVTEATLESAEAAVERLQAVVRRAGSVDGKPDEDVKARFRSAMSEDLNTPTAVQLLFEQAHRANTMLDAGRDASTAVVTLIELAGALGLVLTVDAAPAEIVALAQKRHQARLARDFATADALREELTSAGWRVEDSADGPIVSRLSL